MTNIRVLLADDHAVVREGLKRLIETQSDMSVVAEAADGREAVSRCVQAVPDVAILDVSMGEMGGAEATRQIVKLCPTTKVLALTVHEDKGYLRELLEAGAAGYIIKRAASDELIHAIRSVAAGGIFVDPRIAGKIISSMVQPQSRPASAPARLSDRETEVLRLIAQGYSNKEVAAQLSVSVKTVETYKARSMEKLNLRSRVDIVRKAGELGWLETV
jgi:DNA-binding NarL/FixJ family response regulator